MTLTVEAYDRAFTQADSLGPGQEQYAALLDRLGIHADVFEFLYRTVAGRENPDEDRLATYMLGAVTTLLALGHDHLSGDQIQAFPSAGDRWRGLSNRELQHVIVALEADVTMYRDQSDKDELEKLWRDADEELTRRSGQPEDDVDDGMGVRMPWTHQQELQRRNQPGAPKWQGPGR